MYFWDLERLRSHYPVCGRAENKLCLCDICGKECKTESILRAHRKVHSDSKRIYECFMCKKRNLSRNNIKHHILMTHVNGKPQFKCEHCGRAFGRKEQYTRHKKTHVNNFPFECPHCGKKFRFKVRLNVCIQNIILHFFFHRKVSTHFRNILHFRLISGSTPANGKFKK